MAEGPRRLALRRADRCATCGVELAAGSIALWDPTRRSVTCLECGQHSVSTPPPLRESMPGASARREYDRRRANREARVRERLGPLAGVALALAGEPAHQRAWATGAAGEAKLAAKLRKWTADAGVVLLHDRRVPRTTANIDHIAVGPAGVVVLDAKRYKGRIGVVRRGGLLRERTQHLVVRGADRTKLVDGVERQVEIVRAALGAHGGVAVHGVLCFVDGDWPLLGTLEVRGIPVLPPRRAARLCSAPGPHDDAQREAIAASLAAALPPA
jgi:hypothetical protein